MSIIEKLRGHAAIMERDRGKFVRFIDIVDANEAADTLEALLAYAAHDAGCSGYRDAGASCTCGLDQLLSKLREE